MNSSNICMCQNVAVRLFWSKFTLVHRGPRVAIVKKLINFTGIICFFLGNQRNTAAWLGPTVGDCFDIILLKIGRKFKFSKITTIPA